MKIFAMLCICLLPITVAAQAKYFNKKYGISLQFPNAYKLKEGELGEEDTLGYLGPIPMEFVAPGGVRVVTVEIPPSSFPGTDFNTAFVTLSVNPHLTQDECKRFPDDVSGSRKPITKKISGTQFHGLEQGEGGLGHQFGGSTITRFCKACYELGEGIATSGYGAVDGMKKVDDRQVFAILDRILRSVRIDAAKAAVRAAASPAIWSHADLSNNRIHIYPGYREYIGSSTAC